MKLSFFSLDKFNKFIKVQKDTLPKFFNKNVVYKSLVKIATRMLIKQVENPQEYLSIAIISTAITRTNYRTTELVLIMNLIERMSKFLIKKNFSINV